MTAEFDAQFQGLMIMSLMALPFVIFAFWMEARDERKARERHNNLNCGRTIMMAQHWGTTREEAYKRLKETDDQCDAIQKRLSA